MIRNHIYISDKKYTFRDIFKEFYTSQYLFALRLLTNSHDAEDVVQDVFMNIWKSKPVFKNEIAFKSYIYLSTRNKCFDLIKKKKPVYESSDNLKETPDEIEYLLKEEVFRLLDKAVEKLPPQTRSIIMLSMKGHSIKEIAELLAISVNTVKTLKSRAYKQLKEVYGDSFVILVSAFFTFN
jgi:RNA polymerase sigma-70 factor (ECF subfamily)